MHGLIRRASTFNTARIDHLYVDPHDPDAKLFLHYGDLSDGARLVTLLAEIRPDEVYNLAAQSHVRVSFDEPEHTADTTGIGTDPPARGGAACPGIETRFYQASSSEMFGATPPPQNEDDAVLPALARTARRRCTATGSPRTTARPTACSRSTASCSTTSRRAAARRS